VRIEPNTFRRGLFVLATVVTLVVSVQLYVRTARKLADPAGGHISDFDRWMIMTPRFLHDRVDYVNDDLPTPPLTLIVFAPFAALSRPAAEFAWAWVKLPLACLVFALTTRMVEQTGTRLSTSALLLIVSGWWLAVIVDAQEGQTNFLALLPVVAGLAVAQRETPRAAAAAGALIGLGVAIKLTPIVFVVYFAWRRRWLLVGAAVASIAVCWLVVPAIVFGWDQNVRWFTQWARIMIVPYVARGEIVYASSQSIASFAVRLLSAAPAFESHHGGVTVPHFMNVANLIPATVRQLTRVLMLAAGLAGLWWLRRPLLTLQSRRYIVEIAAVASFMLWFSERTWVHHYVSFIVVLAAAGMLVSDPATPTVAKRSIVTAAAVFFAITLLASEAGKLLGRDGIDWMKAFGVYLFPSMLVTGAVLYAAVDRRSTTGAHA
jgi:hypothetical protein